MLNSCTLVVSFYDLDVETYTNLINDIKKSKNEYCVICKDLPKELAEYEDGSGIIIYDEYGKFKYSKKLMNYLRTSEGIDTGKIEKYILSHFNSPLIKKLIKKIKKL